jgi:hypothetical protein
MRRRLSDFAAAVCILKQPIPGMPARDAACFVDGNG